MLLYTLASLALTLVPPPTEPLITQVYTWCQHSLVSSPLLTASTSDPVLSDDLPIALHKGNRPCAHPISSFFSFNHLLSHSCSFITSLDSISLPNKVSEALAHPGWLLLAPRLDELSSMRHKGAAFAPCKHQGRRSRQIKEASAITR